ncbi:MAG: 16S rRNA (uracil(1498)-N(3))-methyltransferase [Planctomycetes bacterium]|nr:16S rRNA (uracil(1498)-N(3))-methyltransferase [Planctomycetota bacterium]
MVRAAGNLGESIVEVDSRDVNHLVNVLRLGIGAEIRLFDSSGASAKARIVGIEPGKVLAEVIELLKTDETAEWPEITIASAIPKGKRVNQLISGITALGVKRFIPTIFERSVVIPREERASGEKWSAIVDETCKQCGRTTPLEIDPPARIQDVANSGFAGLQLFADIGGERSNSRSDSAEAGILIVIGPEGGFSDQERELLSSREFQPVNLGRFVLRIELACISAAAKFCAP